MTQGELGALISRCFAVFAAFKAMDMFFPLLSISAVSAQIPDAMGAVTGVYSFSVLAYGGLCWFFWTQAETIGAKLCGEERKDKKASTIPGEQGITLLFVGTGCFLLVRSVSYLLAFVPGAGGGLAALLAMVLHAALAAGFILGAEGLKDAVLRLRKTGTVYEGGKTKKSGKK
ncbi:MAG: hypothetical protein EA357_02910 [Micavibrio sp.]|nr:MAG: hypothetical protein EA357_02910 [Micavibrio sp.]